MPPLVNSRHEIFAIATFSGMTGKDAAISAGYRYKNDNVIRMTASRLLTFDNIKTRIAELKEQAASGPVMDRAEKLERLSAIAREDNEGKYGWQREPNISAMRVLNEMTGDNAPTKVDLTSGLKELLDELRGVTPQKIEEGNGDNTKTEN